MIKNVYKMVQISLTLLYLKMNSIFLTFLLLVVNILLGINGKSILKKSPEEEADLFEGDIKGIQVIKINFE